MNSLQTRIQAFLTAMNHVFSAHQRRWLRRLGLSTLVALLLLVTASRSPAAAQTAKHYTDLTFPALPDIQVPDYSQFQLRNGLTVYLMEDHELPLVSGEAYVRTGSRWEPAEKVGLADLTAEVMRTSGTRSHSADELNQLLEQRSAFVETAIGEDFGTASFNTLSEDLDLVFGLFAEVLQEPAFAQEKLDLAKTQRRGGIARRNDDPDGIANREFQKLIYGRQNPYARTVEYETLDNIALSDLESFYRQSFQPQNLILGISGDFDSQEMRSLVEAKFGKWRSQSRATLPPPPKITQAEAGGIFFVNQPQLTQSYIYLGHLGGQFNDPDYPALSVMNSVLNGFGGRLFNEVRSRQGLAYSVFGFWSPRHNHPGIFIAGGQTRSEATVPFIRSVQSEVERIRTAPVSDVELAYAKDSVLNSFVFNFESPEEILSRIMRYAYFGYPEDFIFRYKQQVEATTVEDVQRVAAAYLKPDQLVTLVVGKRGDIQPSLESLDVPVKTLDVTIPGAPTPPAS